jgi:hypothetical protein
MAMERQYAGDARVVLGMSVKVLPKSVERRISLLLFWITHNEAISTGVNTLL